MYATNYALQKLIFRMNLMQR
ncbi:hypothetical protein CGLO_13063 [Colletotrichum gloeosporioides Cg-14]|uniref:Uncharacterized protein n=1 Tax=Colletotrichum gloeosporioides (strain Cg-14) TaxID=1237896 RepID=T0L808_COLGC|nr:hypothetical protein CGLO_13063 [Colletotrichum gloeosporioides Cg-14]